MKQTSCRSIFTLEEWYQRRSLLEWEYKYLISLEQIISNKNLSLSAIKPLIHEQEYQLLPQAAQQATFLIEDGNIRRVANCLKSESPIWKNLKKYVGDLKTNELTGKKTRFYSWDNDHNDIEAFTRNRKHLDSMDPQTGRMYKGPKSTHNLNKQ